MSIPEVPSCIYCGQEITFRRDNRGRRLPFNPDSSRHYCDQYLKNKSRQQPPKEDVFLDTDFDDFTITKVPNGRFNRNTKANRPRQQMLDVLKEVEPAQHETTASAQSDVHHILEQVENGRGPSASKPRGADDANEETISRSPKWTREEIILATDLYIRHQGILFGPKHPEVIQLSNILRTLPLHPERVRKEKFRNPNGVAMKLSNIRACDPHAKSAGHANGSKLDGIYWTELHEDPAALAWEIADIKRRFPQAFSILSIADNSNRVNQVKPRVLPGLSTQKQRTQRVPLPALTTQILPETYQTWEQDMTNLRKQSWFFAIRITDPRFEWFAREFRGQVRPANKYVHEWVASILATPRLIDPENVKTHEALNRLHDYVFFLKDMSLEGELHSLVSSVCTAEEVPLTLRELGWDGHQVESRDSSDETKSTMEAIQRERFWTPVVDRSLNCLRREAIRDQRLIGSTLKLSGVTESSSFSPYALYTVCKVLGKPLPVVLQDFED